MLLQLSDVVGPELFARIASAAAAQASSGPFALGDELLAELRGHPLFALAVQPRASSTPRLLRRDGECASSSVSDALCEGTRVDVGIALFVSDPDGYDGGELLVDTGFGEETYRPAVGDCLVYPASCRVRSAKVTRGVRLTLEFGMQSTIREPVQREILYDLGYSTRMLELFGHGESEELVKLRACEQNLLRLWSEA